MDVEAVSTFVTIDHSNQEHRKNDMKCENTSERKNYNICSDQFINECDIRHIQQYNRAFKFLLIASFVILMSKYISR